MTEHRTCLWALTLLALVACGYQPARFANRPPTLDAHDDDPIPLPTQRRFVAALHGADVYVRRELVKAMSPLRPPRAFDVNSLDEVVRSSWYRGVQGADPLAGYEVDGPPEPPLLVDEDPPVSGRDDAHVVVDARGLRYEVLRDPADRPGLRSTALVVGTRLLHALGYRTAEAYPLAEPGGGRLVAQRWAPGVDLGPTPISDLREEDPNDILPHRERRSLRALRFVLMWLHQDRLEPRTLRDLYLGVPGKGHIEHFILGLEGSLGVDLLEKRVELAADPDRENSNLFFKLFGMGLSPKPPGLVPPTEYPAVGLFNDQLVPEKFKIGPPFEPSDRARPDDDYWIAKTIAALPTDVIREAVAAAAIPSTAQEWLVRRLERRRAVVVAHAFGATTPCELVAVAPPVGVETGPGTVVLDDLAIGYGFVPAHERTYRVELIDGEGRRVIPPYVVLATTRRTRLPLPPALGDDAYVVARVWAQREGKRYPRPLEIHLRRRGARLLFAGLIH